jgi:hypothetical protein
MNDGDDGNGGKAAGSRVHFNNIQPRASDASSLTADDEEQEGKAKPSLQLQQLLNRARTDAARRIKEAEAKEEAEAARKTRPTHAGDVPVKISNLKAPPRMKDAPLRMKDAPLRMKDAPLVPYASAEAARKTRPTHAGDVPVKLKISNLKAPPRMKDAPFVPYASVEAQQPKRKDDSFSKDDTLPMMRKRNTTDDWSSSGETEVTAHLLQMTGRKADKAEAARKEEAEEEKAELSLTGKRSFDEFSGSDMSFMTPQADESPPPKRIAEADFSDAELEVEPSEPPLEPEGLEPEERAQVEAQADQQSQAQSQSSSAKRYPTRNRRSKKK